MLPELEREQRLWLQQEMRRLLQERIEAAARYGEGDWSLEDLKQRLCQRVPSRERQLSPELVRGIRRLVAAPNRVMDSGLLATDLRTAGGIRSSLRRGGREVLPFDLIKQQADRIHIQIGPPYIFGAYGTRLGTRQPTHNCLVVFEGDRLLARPDVQVAAVDSGVIYRYFNPFSTTIDQLGRVCSASTPSAPDPYCVFIAEILSNPPLQERFDQVMGQQYRQLCLPPAAEFITQYLSEIWYGLLPLYEGAEADSGLLFPEINVCGLVSLEEIRAILCYPEDYQALQEMFPQWRAKFFKVASVSQNPRLANTTRAIDLPLLEAYTVFTHTEELLADYLSQLRYGQELPLRTSIQELCSLEGR